MKLKNPAFQPGGTGQAPLLQPARSLRWAQVLRWTGGQVKNITPGPQPPARVELNGFVFTPSRAAAVAPASLQPAGNGR